MLYMFKFSDCGLTEMSSKYENFQSSTSLEQNREEIRRAREIVLKQVIEHFFILELIFEFISNIK